MLDLLVRRGYGIDVEFRDAAGAEHIVVLSGDVPDAEAPLIAREKLETWAREGRAVFADPLELVKVIRRR